MDNPTPRYPGLVPLLVFGLVPTRSRTLPPRFSP
jgi:hypothetical protein